MTQRRGGTLQKTLICLFQSKIKWWQLKLPAAASIADNSQVTTFFYVSRQHAFFSSGVSLRYNVDTFMSMSEKHQRNQYGFGYTIHKQQELSDKVVGFNFAVTILLCFKGSDGTRKNSRWTNSNFLQRTNMIITTQKSSEQKISR